MNRSSTFPSHRKKAFTLMEIMIVVVIVGLLAALAIPSFGIINQRSKERIITNNLRQIAAGAQNYFMENGVDEVFLVSLVGDNKWLNQLDPVAGETYPTFISLADTELVATGATFGDISVSFW